MKRCLSFFFLTSYSKRASFSGTSMVRFFVTFSVFSDILTGKNFFKKNKKISKSTLLFLA